MTAIAIICIVMTVILAYTLIASMAVGDGTSAIEQASLIALAMFIAVYCVKHKDDVNVETIHCSEIQQIDTVYKDNSIVGYEILIVR